MKALPVMAWEGTSCAVLPPCTHSFWGLRITCTRPGPSGESALLLQPLNHVQQKHLAVAHMACSTAL